MVTIHRNMQALAILVAGPTPRPTYSPSLMERKSCPTFSTTWPEHDPRTEEAHILQKRNRLAEEEINFDEPPG